jgi:membrane-bound lytic murein transglycosylase D
LPDYVSVSGLSTALEITPAELARHNPALQATVWQGSKYLPRGYVLRIPAGSVQQPLTQILAALPEDAVFDKQLPDMFHTVARGDTLSEIAHTYDTRVSTLVALNSLSSSNRIRAGQRLRLPAAGPAPAVVAPSGVTIVASNEVVVEETPGDERTAESLANEFAATLLGRIQTALLADPSDYTVASDKSIEVQELETLGHFGDWLEIKTQRLRDINGLAFRTPLAVGQRIKLDLDTVDAKVFEERRIAYHREQQDSFFQQHIIIGVTEHTIRSGESIWILALRQYKVPVWLFRQYNPEISLDKVQPGTKVQMPLLSDVDSA